ncbi:MAG: dienelactone hydrolase family protein [Aquabacterium sp.]|nr:dienelactone hydrolase family protein [Aquabacterium sp.]
MFNLKHTLASVTLGLLTLAPLAHAVQNGPAPTLADLQKDGPYAVASQTVTGSGFGGGTVYSPTTAGKYALVAVCPGFVSAQSSMTDMSKRLATHGFVVVAITTNTLLDFPSSRATQLLAALKTVAAVTTGPAVGKIDTARQAVSGWSMGGGGTLEAASATLGLVAAVAFAPWDTAISKFKTNKVPTAIIGGSSDTVASVSAHSQKFYAAIPSTTKKMLAVITGADHFFPTKASEPTSYTNISWMKRFADGDTRYSPFLKGQDAAWSSFTSNGPF